MKHINVFHPHNRSYYCIIIEKEIVIKNGIQWNQFYLQHIDEVSFQSSCFNSEINKLVSVVIRGVEVTNNVEEKRSVVVETILKPLLSKQNSSAKGDSYGETGDFRNLESSLNRIANKELLDFRDKKLPHSLIMFAQVCGCLFNFLHSIFILINLDRIKEIGFVWGLSNCDLHATGKNKILLWLSLNRLPPIVKLQTVFVCNVTIQIQALFQWVQKNELYIA